MTTKLVVSQPAYGMSPAGFPRLHVEMYPREVARLVGYDPRTLIMKPKKAGTTRGTRDIVPHNVPEAIVSLQNTVQRSIDPGRVEQMVNYLAGALNHGLFADWGPIELVTATSPDMAGFESAHEAALDSDADYFIADGQHRYCALLDFIRAYPNEINRFTQSVTISILPEDKLVQWAGQAFHDRNYFSVPVRAGKALAVDTQDPLNAFAKTLASHKAITEAGGIAYERDTLLKNDTRFTTHTILHRFVRGFLFGRQGLDKWTDTTQPVDEQEQAKLEEYLGNLGRCLPWGSPNREEYLTRTSAVLNALSVVGHELYHAEPALTPQEIQRKTEAICAIDWRRANLGLVGVVGSEKEGQVAPTSSRQSIDATIRFIREKIS